MDMDPVKEGCQASCILQDGTVALFSWEHALFFKKREGWPQFRDHCVCYSHHSHFKGWGHHHCGFKRPGCHHPEPHGGSSQSIGTKRLLVGRPPISQPFIKWIDFLWSLFHPCCWWFCVESSAVPYLNVWEAIRELGDSMLCLFSTPNVPNSTLSSFSTFQRFPMVMVVLYPRCFGCTRKHLGIMGLLHLGQNKKCL